MTTWLQQASSASGYLGRLYLELKDPLQRDRALEAGTFARERCRARRPPVSGAPGPWVGKPGHEGERMAWRALIEALLGLTMLVALGVEGSSKASPLHRHLDQELKQALLGFTTAFPGDMVEQDLDQLSDGVICAAAGVAEQAWIEVRRPEESGVDVGRFLREKWSRAIRPSLLSFIWGPASPRSSETRSRP